MTKDSDTRTGSHWFVSVLFFSCAPQKTQNAMKKQSRSGIYVSEAIIFRCHCLPSVGNVAFYICIYFHMEWFTENCSKLWSAIHLRIVFQMQSNWLKTNSYYMQKIASFSNETLQLTFSSSIFTHYFYFESLNKLHSFELFKYFRSMEKKSTCSCSTKTYFKRETSNFTIVVYCIPSFNDPILRAIYAEYYFFLSKVQKKLFVSPIWRRNKNIHVMIVGE